MWWPPTVLLGACWVAVTANAVGRDPIGFPIACLTRGAKTVIGGIAPIDATESAMILANVARALPITRSAGRALQLATSQHLQRHPDLRGRPPATWAAIASWTIELAPNTIGQGRPFTLHSRRDGTTQPADPTDRFGSGVATVHSATPSGESETAYFAAPRSATTYTSIHDAIVGGRDPLGWNTATKPKLFLLVVVTLAVFTGLYFGILALVQGTIGNALPEHG
jgi:hypothetical protein